MSAVILFEFPSARTDASSWIFAHSAKLAIEGRAEIKFIGTEPAGSGSAGRETIALEFDSVEHARSTLSQWRQDAEFPALIETRLLEIRRAPLADAVFP